MDNVKYLFERRMISKLEMFRWDGMTWTRTARAHAIAMLYVVILFLFFVLTALPEVDVYESGMGPRSNRCHTQPGLASVAQVLAVKEKHEQG